MATIGDNLKKARTRLGFTQKEVEARLNLRSLSMKDFETERLKLSAELASKFATLFHVSIDELISGKPPLRGDSQQKYKLSQVEFFFSKGEMDLILLDPVIRAFLEEYPEKMLDTPIFDILLMDLGQKQRRDVISQLLMGIGSLMGSDLKITETEMSFLTRLSVRFGFDEDSKIITKSLSNKTIPQFSHFHHRPALRHFHIWLLFYVAKTSGHIKPEELSFIEHSAEVLRIHRSHFLGIQKYFIREIH